MIPVGYMLKQVKLKADWLKVDNVVDVYSVSGCISPDFTDYIKFWKHNGWWFFDSPEIILEIATVENINISNSKMFYYEIYEYDYDCPTKLWESVQQETAFQTNVIPPNTKKLEGYDLVNYSISPCGSPECSALSCNGVAEDVPVNQHCLLQTLEEAKKHLEDGKLDNAEPGTYKIFAVYSV